MAYSLVGSAGAVTVGTSGAAVTPAWDAGAPRTAGDLLLCLVAGWGSGDATIPAPPAGWTVVRTVAVGGNVNTPAIFYKLAAGSDTAPTVAGIVGMTWGVQLLEFAGNVPSAPTDQSSYGFSSGTSPFTLAANATDANAGELVVWAVPEATTSAMTATLATSPNNGITAHDVTNNSTSTTHHYLFGWGITTGNGVADSTSITFDDVGAASDVLAAIASFLVQPLSLTASLTDTLTLTQSLARTVALGWSPQSNLRATMRARRY